MSYTKRLVLNNERISTGVELPSGELLQVFPNQKDKIVFKNTFAWWDHWNAECKTSLILDLCDKKYDSPSIKDSP
jgi:hypothetical protein